MLIQKKQCGGRHSECFQRLIESILANFGLKDKHFSPSQKGGKADKYSSYTSMDFSKWRHEGLFFFSNYKVPQEQHIIISGINRQEKDKIGAIKAKQIKQIITLDILHSLSFLEESPIFCASLYGQFIQSSRRIRGSIREKGVIASSNLSRKT